MKQIKISTALTNRDSESLKKYLAEIARIKPFAAGEEMACAIKAKDGDEKAVTELIIRNLRFVVSVAKRYSSDIVPLNDLVNQGNLGLIEASKNYDPNRGLKFISYSVFWVRKFILEYLNEYGRMIRLPANQTNKLAKMRKELRKLQQEAGEHVGFELVDGYTHDDLMLISYKMDSLDREVNGYDGEGIAMIDTMESDTFLAPDQLILNEELKLKIAKAMSFLKEREKIVLVGVFGLDGGYPKTLGDLGEELGLTSEGVRLIKNSAVKKMQHRLVNNVN